MTKQRLLGGGKPAAMILCCLVAMAAGRAASLQTTTPEGWPQRLGERRLHTCEYGFVYARQKSAVDQFRKVLATVAKDAQQEGVVMSGAGLILVVDVKEDYPCDVARLVEQLKKVDPNLTAEESEKGLRAIVDSEKQTKELGLDLSVMLSLAPIPIRPEVVPEIVGGLPTDAGRQVGWCVICPTDRCLKAGFKKTFEAALRKEKPGLAERAAIAALRPLIERKAISMMRKGRQAGLYTLLLSGRTDLSPEQRRQKVEAYRNKLGLDRGFDAENDPNTPGEPEEDQADSE